MTAGVQLLIIIIVLCLSVTNGSCRVIYVTPEKEHNCPHDTQQCYTLSHLAEKPMNYFFSNTRIIFLPAAGNHTTDANRSIVIANVSNITLEGSGSTVQCIKYLEVGFVFIQVTNLSITNLHLNQCGTVLPEGVELEIYKITTLSMLFECNKDFYTKSSPTLYFIQVTNITVSRVSIYNSTGPGLLGFNIIGHSTISQSSFVRNNPNCILLFMDTTAFTPVVQLVKLSIFDSQLLFGGFIYNQKADTLTQLMHLCTAAGLSATTAQTSYKVSLTITNVTAHANNGIPYGNFFFSMMAYCSNNVTIHLHRINSSLANYYFNTGLTLKIESSLIISNTAECSTLQQYIHAVIISQSYFGQNAKAVDISTRNSLIKETGVITLVNTTFHCNSLALRLEWINAILNNVRFTYNIAKVEDSNAPIKIENCNVEVKGSCTFTENWGYTAAVAIQDSSVWFQGNTTFLRNRGETAGAIYSYASQLHVKSNVQFVENEGYDGGAIALYEQSEIILTYSKILARNSKVDFIRNHAIHYGGALYINTIRTTEQLRCCYSLENYTSSIDTSGLMVFTNNTSDVAGSAIHGGWVKLCYISGDQLYPGYLIFKQIFEINADTSDLSPVSSDPVRVCICSDSKPVCNITHHTVKAYPGETFQISAVGVGQMYGTVPSTIRAQFRQTNATIQPNLENLQQVQRVEQFCSYLSYTVKSSNTVEDIILTVHSDISKEVLVEMNTSVNYSPLSPKKKFYDTVIHIDLQTCPLGFVMDKTVCICHPRIQTLGIQCNIATGRIYKDAQIWVNATFHKGVLTGVIVHQTHPFDYCKPNSLNLSLDNPDEQCAFHRSGILCGACQHNLSHVLGSSNCKQCSSLWPILLIPTTAIVGIVLVVFLMLLNLTVSVGTINGLTFYANIVRANQAVFFPHNINNSFLSWFIAWVNLDLGFEVCFYNGMDAYAKTWLQFVFPIYIWLIVILIIVSSHYYTTAARISGRNAVQVLATLFLLSYAKLLRLTITILSSTTLEYPDGSIRRVWLYDGNVDYLKGKHIPLFMAALLVLLVLSLPYTALLLFIQCLQLKSKYRVLFWIGKFKPLFDAYTGPYKDKHCYWTGLLLLVRAVLFLIFSVNVIGDSSINLFAIATMTFLLVAVSKHVYKVQYLNVLEYSSLLNLGITSTASLFTRLTTENQTALTYTSVGIAFVTFCVIVLHHAVIRIKEFCQQNHYFQQTITRMNGLKQRINSDQQNQNQETHRPGHTTHPPGNPQVPITFIELREPLLEYCSNS